MTIAAMHLRNALALTALTAMITACGGSPNTPSGPVVGSPGNGGPPPTKLVDVKVTVSVPLPSRGLKPAYISPNTESLVVQLVSVNGSGVTGVNPTILNTLPKSRDCSQGDHATVCTATAKGSPGQDVFAVTAYAGLNGTGAVLSVGTVQAAISGSGSGVGINKLSLTIEGVIASLKLTLSPDQAKRGTRTTSSVTLDAYDASGAQIVGPSDYSQPLTVTIQGDAQNAFTLHDAKGSGQTLIVAKPTSGITLDYDGNSQASSVTVVASTSGPSSVSASKGFTLTGKQPPPPVGTIYVLNLGANDGKGGTVTVYDGKAKGNAAPERSLALDPKLYARSIAVDANNNLYVGYFDNALGYSPASGKPDTGNEIAVYPPDASGSGQPSYVLSADTNSQSALFPLFIAFDASGRLVTYGATGVDNNGGNDAVLTYASGASGQTAPLFGFDFQNPQLHYAGPTGLTLDSAGNFYVNGALAGDFGPDYGMYVAASADIGNPSAQPARTLPWDSITQLSSGLTTNVDLDASGEILIGKNDKQGSGTGESCQAQANVYSAGATGSTTDDPPLRVLTLGDMFTQGDNCASSSNPLVEFFPELTIYGTTLFAVDDFNNAVNAYPAGSHGVVKPTLQITGSATLLDAPIAVVITSVSGQAKAGPVTGVARAGTTHSPPDALNAQ